MYAMILFIYLSVVELSGFSNIVGQEKTDIPWGDLWWKYEGIGVITEQLPSRWKA